MEQHPSAVLLVRERCLPFKPMGTTLLPSTGLLRLISPIPMATELLHPAVWFYPATRSMGLRLSAAVGATALFSPSTPMELVSGRYMASRTAWMGRFQKMVWFSRVELCTGQPKGMERTRARSFLSLPTAQALPNCITSVVVTEKILSQV